MNLFPPLIGFLLLTTGFARFTCAAGVALGS